MIYDLGRLLTHGYNQHVYQYQRQAALKLERRAEQ